MLRLRIRGSSFGYWKRVGGRNEGLREGKMWFGGGLVSYYKRGRVCCGIYISVGKQLGLRLRVL